MNLSTICAIFFLIILQTTHRGVHSNNDENYGECSIETENGCGGKEDEINQNNLKDGKYQQGANAIYKSIQKALKNYTPCTEQVDAEDHACLCHADTIDHDLAPYSAGITQSMLEDASAAKYGTRYKILKRRLYRDSDCMFPARCTGIEYFLLRLLPKMPDMDLIVNTRDWPQLRNFGGTGSSENLLQRPGPVFSFSKTDDYRDIMYPAWSFWAGGPAITLHPTGIGRWDLLRESIDATAARDHPWTQKLAKGFFRGSRTSDERDALVLLSRRAPQLVDAQYTKNQAWKSPKDTLNADPAPEVSFAQHCQYKYLFNFRGVAASFRLKHLFLCKSLIFHVGDEWREFFYSSLKPWVHYVPLHSYPNEQELEEILLFFRQHDELARAIAERGHAFIWQHLRMSDVECYWEKLLQRYQKLLKYEVAADENLIEIGAVRT